jgi:hypothetical protein
MRMLRMMVGLCGLWRTPMPDVASGGPAKTTQVKATPVGLASWYGQPHQGRTTASGARVSRQPSTAAHRSWPWGPRSRWWSPSMTAAPTRAARASSTSPKPRPRVSGYWNGAQNGWKSRWSSARRKRHVPLRAAFRDRPGACRSDIRSRALSRAEAIQIFVSDSTGLTETQPKRSRV